MHTHHKQDHSKQRLKSHGRAAKDENPTVASKERHGHRAVPRALRFNERRCDENPQLQPRETDKKQLQKHRSSHQYETQKHTSATSAKIAMRKTLQTSMFTRPCLQTHQIAQRNGEHKELDADSHRHRVERNGKQQFERER
jgi:hypothetical protein